MLWESFIEHLSAALSIGNTAVTALIFSLLITSIMILVISVTTRSQMGTIIMGFMGISFFTVAGWLDPWVLLMLMLIVAGLYAKTVKEVFE